MYGDIPFVFGNLLWACSVWVLVLREVLKCDEWRKIDREDLLGTWGMGFEYPNEQTSQTQHCSGLAWRVLILCLAWYRMLNYVGFGWMEFPVGMLIEPNKPNTTLLRLGLNSFYTWSGLFRAWEFFGTNCSTWAYIWTFVIMISSAWLVMQVDFKLSNLS